MHLHMVVINQTKYNDVVSVSATDFCYSYFLVAMHHNFVKKSL